MFFIKRIYVLFFLFAFVLGITAQDRSKAIDLKNILQSLEKQHHVIFNYVDNDVLYFKIKPPHKFLSLDKKIEYLHKKTNLSFENIDNQFINIYKNNAVDTKKICGYVFSKTDNSPMENVNIQVINGNRTTTDKKGYFEVNKENSDELTISNVGFATKKITAEDLTNKNCPTFFMDIETSELNNIMANHFLTSGISKKNNGTFEIKPKNLGILPGLIEPDILQTMLQIPGIYSVDESLSSINVRGGTHDQNLFLWNGIKMYQTGHFFGLISAFNPNLAHTISVSKNGDSAFYGESLSSVIAISSNPNSYKNNNFSFGINMINADIYSKFSITKNGFLEIAGRKSITDFIKSPTYKQYYNKAFQNTSITNFSNNQDTDYSSNEKFNFYDITVKYFQKIGERDQLILDFITINDQLKVAQKKTTNNSIQSEDNSLYQKNIGGNLSWKRNWNTKNSSSIDIYTSSYELDAEKNQIQTNQIVSKENRVLDNGIKLENRHVFNSKFKLNNGYQFNEIGTTNLDAVNSPSFYRNIKEVLRNHALIAEGIYSDTLSKIYLSAGLRVNYIEQFKKYLLEPRLQFNYGITQNLNLEILGEIKSQNSLQIIDLQNDYFGIEKRRWILANNSTIPIETSKQVSISFSYKKNNWLLNLENFYKKANGITSSGQGFQNQLEFVKINGDYEISGAEILVQKKINHFITWLSYTYNNNNYSFQKLEQPIFSNNFELKHIVTWAGIYEKDNLKISIGSKWHSGRPETTPSSTIINYSNPLSPTIAYNSPNNKILEDFFQVDFSSTYKWTDSKGMQYKLGLSILNILNRKNEISEYYRINTSTNSIEDVKIFSLKRTPNLSFRISI